MIVNNLLRDHLLNVMQFVLQLLASCSRHSLCFHGNISQILAEFSRNSAKQNAHFVCVSIHYCHANILIWTIIIGSRWCFFPSDVVIPLQKKRAHRGRKVLRQSFLASTTFIFLLCNDAGNNVGVSSVCTYLVLFASASALHTVCSLQWTERLKCSHV